MDDLRFTCVVANLETFAAAEPCAIRAMTVDSHGMVPYHGKMPNFDRQYQLAGTVASE